jgi:hypothetical protein
MLANPLWDPARLGVTTEAGSQFVDCRPASDLELLFGNESLGSQLVQLGEFGGGEVRR